MDSDKLNLDNIPIEVIEQISIDQTDEQSEIQIPINYDAVQVSQECVSSVVTQDAVDGPSTALQKRKRKKSKYPPHVKALLGEANLRFARGDTETAEKICYEVIRQWPKASEAYLTLAQLMETRDPEKSLQLQFMAAVTDSGNVNLWVSTAQTALERNNLKLAVSCYNFALYADRENYELHKKRIEVLEMIGNKAQLAKAYVKAMNILSADHSKELLDVSLKAALLYNEMQEYNKAIETLDTAFKKCPNSVTPEMVNIMLDLLINIENYTYCLDIFFQYCNIEIEVMIGEQNNINILSCVVPENILIDFRVKFIICLIKLGSFHLIDELLKPILGQSDLDSVADLYLDLAEAFMSSNQFESASKLIIPLVKDKNLSLPAIWLKYGECLLGCGMFEQAVEAFEVVIQAAPQHTDVKTLLADALCKLNREKEALSILKQDPKTESVDVDLLLKRISVLKNLKQYDELFECTELLLLRHSLKLKHYEELRAVIYSETQVERIMRLQKMRSFRGDNSEEMLTFSVSEEPSIEREYAVLKDSLRLCKEQKNYTAMQKLAFTAITSTKLKDKFEELQLIAFYASLLNRDACNAYPLLRDMLMHNKSNNLVWNLYNCLLQFAEFLRHTRFLTHFLQQNEHHPQVRMLEANHCLESGSYKLAMMYCLNYLRNNNSSLYLLILSIILLQICCQKFTIKKEELLSTCVNAIGAYSNMRSQEAYEEINYNLGRMFHHIGFFHLAIAYYKKVLEYENPLQNQYPYLSLKKEAAYNLHLIYKESGNRAAALQLLMKYIKI